MYSLNFILTNFILFYYSCLDDISIQPELDEISNIDPKTEPIETKPHKPKSRKLSLKQIRKYSKFWICNSIDFCFNFLFNFAEPPVQMQCKDTPFKKVERKDERKDDKYATMMPKKGIQKRPSNDNDLCRLKWSMKVSNTIYFSEPEDQKAGKIHHNQRQSNKCFIIFVHRHYSRLIF